MFLVVLPFLLSIVAYSKEVCYV